jgi:type II secretory pathway pseudopilin PulG
MFKPQLKKLQQRSSTEEGFTLFEVIVTTLIISGFFLAGLQAIVISTALRLEAKELSESMLWIEEDLDWIRYNGSSIKLPYVKNTASDPEADDRCESSSVTTVNITNGFANDFRQNVLTADAAINLERDVENSLNSSKTTFYREDLALPLKVDNLDIPNTYQMIRTITLKDESPFDVIKVKYEVHNDNPYDSTTLVEGTEEVEVEVIPDATFQCPE